MGDGVQSGAGAVARGDAPGPEVPTRTYALTLSYDGTDYAGFQVQPNRRTVQGELERAIERITQETVRVKASGRTDAGVHAYGQVVSFRSAWRHAPEELLRALNAVLPADIVVRGLALRGPEFHARFSAAWRTYAYSVYQGEWRSPLLDRYAHRVSVALDLPAMRAAAGALVGEHDFAAFGRPTVGHSTVRRVRRAAWVAGGPGAEGGWLAPGVAGWWQFQIEANGFLRGMVRRMVGTLLEVGTGARGATAVEELLRAPERSEAGPPAPARGLCLWAVRYD